VIEIVEIRLVKNVRSIDNVDRGVRIVNRRKNYKGKEERIIEL